MSAKCFVCEEQESVKILGAKVINNFFLHKCRFCGMVVAFPVCLDTKYEDFSNYGDFLMVRDEDVVKRVKENRKKIRALLGDNRRYFAKGKMLDFGSGAGFFCKAAVEEGFNIFGVEKSKKLKSFSENKLKIQNIFGDIDEIQEKFDVVFMFDVIEHFNPLDSRGIMEKIVAHLKPGGLLIGQTPNFTSLNIILFKDRDPVIWPPSHSCYFTMRTLDRYLSSLRLKKIRVFTKGLSSNSFFRRSKFEKSFLEYSRADISLYLLPFYVSFKVLFRGLGYVVGGLRLGYEIVFLYKFVHNSE